MPWSPVRIDSMSEIPIPAEVFVAQATGLNTAQKQAVLSLNLLGAKTYSRWASIARAYASVSGLPDSGPLSAYAAALGVSEATAAIIVNRFGEGSRTRQVWIALIDRYLEDELVWNSKCGGPSQPVTPIPVDPVPNPGGGFELPAGEGFLERHLGVLQMTLLLKDEVALTDAPDPAGSDTTVYPPMLFQIPAQEE